jgi:peptide/nickel transport system permease protein
VSTDVPRDANVDLAGDPNLDLAGGHVGTELPTIQGGLAPAELPPAERRGAGMVRDLLFSNRQATVGAVVLLFFTVVAILAPVLEPYSTTQQVGPVYAPPSSQHWLGLDDGGIDMLSEVIQGARVSMIVGFAASLVAMLIGGVVGVVSGYFGGKSDIALMRMTDYFLVIPDVPLMIVAAAIFGRSLINIIVIIGIIYWASTARLIRAQVKSLRERVYVKRSRALGASHNRLIWFHVLPQVTPLLVANTVLMIATAIFAETYISFLGLGDPSTISWGKLIQNSLTGGAVFHSAWWAIIPPGLCVTIVILACTMMGQSMEDALNPRLRVGHLSTRRFRIRPFSARIESRIEPE